MNQGQPPLQYPEQPSGQPNLYPGQPVGQPGPYPGQPAGQPGPYQDQPQAPYPGGPPQGSYPGGTPQGQYQGPPQGAHPEDVQIQRKGEIPAKPVEGNPNAVPSPPSVPPLEKMDTVAGYESVDFGGGMLPPPSYDEAMRQEKPKREAVTGLPQIRENEAREALLAFVAENCCYGSGAAKDLAFKDLQHSSAFHYTLETFGEGRSTTWAHEPYSGQPIDGAHNGPAPGPWDIQAQASVLFKDQKVDVEVPHTASIKPCHNCLAEGHTRCDFCYGRGQVLCSSCGGSGKSHYGNEEGERCSLCFGDGYQSCSSCYGSGTITCNCCIGQGKLKCYIKLTVLWKNHVKDHIVVRTELPDALIRNVTGEVAFEEQQLRVWPINHFPDAEINSESQRIVQEHSAAFPSERLLMQRHKVRIIPVTQAFYKWKGQDLDFFVYGFEKKVYAPTYPQQCCCGCNLL